MGFIGRVCDWVGGRGREADQATVINKLQGGVGGQVGKCDWMPNVEEAASVTRPRWNSLSRWLRAWLPWRWWWKMAALWMAFRGPKRDQQHTALCALGTETIACGVTSSHRVFTSHESQFGRMSTSLNVHDLVQIWALPPAWWHMHWVMRKWAAA